jgi:hypothetical protein
MTLQVSFKRFICYNESEGIQSNHFLVLNSQVTACVKGKLSPYAERLLLAQRGTNKCSSTQPPLQRHFIFAPNNLDFFIALLGPFEAVHLLRSQPFYSTT